MSRAWRGSIRGRCRGRSTPRRARSSTTRRPSASSRRRAAARLQAQPDRARAEDQPLLTVGVRHPGPDQPARSPRSCAGSRTRLGDGGLHVADRQHRQRPRARAASTSRRCAPARSTASSPPPRGWTTSCSARSPDSGAADRARQPPRRGRRAARGRRRRPRRGRGSRSSTRLARAPPDRPPRRPAERSRPAHQRHLGFVDAMRGGRPA